MNLIIKDQTFTIDPETHDRIIAEDMRFHLSKSNYQNQQPRSHTRPGKPSIGLAKYVMGLPPTDPRKVFFISSDKKDYRRSNLMIQNGYLETDNPEVTCLLLGRGQSCLVDTESLPMISRHKWYAAELKSGSGMYYAVRLDQTTGKLVLLHRELLGLPRDADRDKVGNHVSFDTLDNRLENLEILTNDQNKYLTDKKRPNLTGYEGVLRSGKKYLAHTTVEGTHYEIYGMPTAELAASARNYLQDKYRKDATSRRRRNFTQSKFDGRTLRRFSFNIREVSK